MHETHGSTGASPSTRSHDLADIVILSEDMLAPMVGAGTDLGAVLPSVSALLPPNAGYTVNVGALDHFAGMVGTESYQPEVISESAGTVLSLSMLTAGWTFEPDRLISFHRGLGPDDIVLFSCAENGGVVLDWYRNAFLSSTTYDELDHRLGEVDRSRAPMFLPFLTGTNPPEYFTDARGAFVDIGLEHTAIDMAYAVEEGVAHLLRANIDYFAATDRRPDSIVSTGGGARSRFWNQLKADICALTVRTPGEAESACRGAAVLGLVAGGVLAGVDEARCLSPLSFDDYTPHPSTVEQARYTRYLSVIDALYR